MQLDKKAGELLKADLEKQGMHFRMQARTEEILGEQDVTGIKLSDGSILKADLVVMAVGIRPYTQVAQASGLEVNKGIVVNDFMQTSDKHVYAVGECAEHNGRSCCLVAPVYEQANVLADYLSDSPTEGDQDSTTLTSLKVSRGDLYSACLIHESDEVRGVAIFDSMHKYDTKV